MKKIWIDCDPGVDDAVALMFAVAHRSEWEILGLSTVAGNQTIEKVTKNAQSLAALLGLSVEVAKGAEGPLEGPVITAESVHGETGLGRVSLPAKYAPLSAKSATEAMADTFWGLPKGEKVTLVALGPLTNIALLLQKEPRIEEQIEEIIFMGGAAWGGNITAAAEFNCYADPKAAKLVLDAGIPTVMCGLDVTMKCGLTRNQIAKLCQHGNAMGVLCGELMGQFLQVPVYEVNPVIPAHDVVPLMYLLMPEIFGGEKLPVDVDCSDGICRGQTVCDRRYLQEEEDLHIKVLQKADARAFQECLIESLFEMENI